MIYEYTYSQKMSGVKYYIFKDASGNSFRFTSSQIKELYSTNIFKGIAISSKDGRIYFPKGTKSQVKAVKQIPQIQREVSKISITTGEKLRLLANSVNKLNPRSIVNNIINYIKKPLELSESICIVHGLRRTGKTTAMMHTIYNLINNGIDPDEICYIVPNLENKTKMHELLVIISKLKQKYIFIDEITYVTNFIESANQITDLFMPMNTNKRIIITGTDSFTFSQALRSTLLGRAYIVNSTWLEYIEYIRITNKQDNIDEAIKESGILYNRAYDNIHNSTKEVNSAVFANVKNTISRNRRYESDIPKIVLDLDNSLLTYIAYSIIYSSIEDKNKSSLNRNLPKLNKNIVSTLEEYGGLNGNDYKKYNSIKISLINSIINILEDLNLVYKFNNLIADDKDNNIKSITDLEIICMIQSLFYSIKSQKVVTNKVKGELFENFIISQAIMYNARKGRFDQIGYAKYQKDGVDHEIDLLMISDKSNSYAIEIKHSTEQNTDFKKHLIHSSLPQVIGRDPIKYVVYRGKTIVNNEYTYINANDFLINLDKWLN